ncbi:hypothetical protein [Pseudobutyrivibrio sp. MD2005]|uniref:hypothetical protein n=1 Tax=Pseudobutyrivibrio sp. MD2005 TaxID=1410616 RepID=UPI000480D87D|nr:hypothetical protein [Pseudobutyrivibrio sp. MD2005]
MIFSFAITLIFLIFVVFWIQIPGMLFESILLPRRLKFSTRLLAAFFIGFMYLATLYYIESLTGIKNIILVAGPVASVVGIMAYIKKGRPSLLNADEQFRGAWVIIFAFIFIASSLSFLLKFNGALSGVTTQVYHDYLFHTGNIVSLSRSFPNVDIRVSGLQFYYHYYYELIFAMCKHIFKMDAFRLYMNGNALICAWPLTLALVTIGEKLRAGRISHKFNYFFYCSGTLVSCICVMPLNVVGVKLPFSWLDNHLFSNANAMGLAMSLTVVLVDILVEVWYDKFDLRVIIALYLLSAAATGFKGTTGILLVAITWAVFVIEAIIMKNFHLERMLYVISVTLGFVFTYLTVTVGIHSSGSNNRAMQITPAGTLEAGRVGQLISKLGFDYMAFPWVVIGVILAAICIVGPCILPFVGYAHSKFKVLIKEGVIGDIFDWFVIGLAIMGVIGFCFISVPGLSQGYFVITNAALIFYGSVRYIIDNRRKLISRIACGFFVLGAVFLLVDIAYSCYSDIKQNAVYQKPAGDEPSLVSASTMEAYLWLRDNTAEDAMVAVDRFSEETDYRDIYFYCGAFSERQCYLEGYDYSDVTDKQIAAMLSINESFYNTDSAKAEIAMEMNGIDYLVVTKAGHPDFQNTSRRLNLVFINDEVQIYQFCSDGGMIAVK